MTALRLPFVLFLAASGHAFTTRPSLNRQRLSFQKPLFASPPPDTATTAERSAVVDEEEPFAVRLNEFFKGPVPNPIKEAFSIYKDTDESELNLDDPTTILSAAPGSPGVPRPLWIVALASLPTGLLWYGYYKFAIEEELLQAEIELGIEPQGFGGYGTLGPFTYGLGLGFVAEFLHLPGGLNWSALGVIFIYYTQFLLYDRVNKLYSDEGAYPQPLQVWWCFPVFFPFNLIVGLRQVHFLSQYFYRQRGRVNPPKDPVADFFPFIQAEPFTWQEFLLTPSLWCSLLSDVEKIDAKKLPEPIQQFLALGTNSTQADLMVSVPAVPTVPASPPKEVTDKASSSGIKKEDKAPVTKIDSDIEEAEPFS